jgi:hypothetical protein
MIHTTLDTPGEKIHRKGEQQSRTTEEAGRKEGRLMKFLSNVRWSDSHGIRNKVSKTMSDGSDSHDIGNKVSKQCQMEAIHTTLGVKKML